MTGGPTTTTGGRVVVTVELVITGFADARFFFDFRGGTFDVTRAFDGAAVFRRFLTAIQSPAFETMTLPAGDAPPIRGDELETVSAVRMN